LHLDLRLRLLKVLVNFPVRLLDRFLPDPKPYFPQTQILDSMYIRMFQVYRLEQAQGVFKEVGNFNGDGNFLRLLRVSRKLLIGIADDDRYYREWLGLLILLAHEEYQSWFRSLTAQEIKYWTQVQWCISPSCLRDKFVEDLKDEFAPDVLTYYLHTLSQKRYSNFILQEKKNR